MAFLTGRLFKVITFKLHITKKDFLEISLINVTEVDKFKQEYIEREQFCQNCVLYTHMHVTVLTIT